MTVVSYGPNKDYGYLRSVTFGDMTLGHGLDTPLDHGESSELWPEQGLWLSAHCDLINLVDKTLVRIHDTPFGQGHYLCEILSKSNVTVVSYGPNKNYYYMYVCSVILTLEIWPWFKVITHPWVMNNNCLEY